MKRKQGIRFFISTCIPGCGQMHQGYMKRGMSLLLVFCAIFAVAIFLEIGALAVFLPVAWLYSFFDSYNLRSQMDNGTAPADDFLFGLSDMDSQKLNELCRKRHSIIGWVLVLVGLYMLYDVVVRRWLYFLWQLPIIGDLLYSLPRLLTTLAVIALGIWFIRGPRQAAPSQEDFQTFVPPTEPTAEQPETQEVSHDDEVQ